MASQFGSDSFHSEQASTTGSIRGLLGGLVSGRSQVSMAASMQDTSLTGLESLHNCIMSDINMWPAFSGVNEEQFGAEGVHKQAIFAPQKRRELNGNFEGLYSLAARTTRWIKRLKDAKLVDPDNSYGYAVQVPQNLEDERALLIDTEFRRAKEAACNYQQIMRVNYLPIKPEVTEVTLKFKDIDVLKKSLGIHTTDDLVLPYPLITQIREIGLQGAQQIQPGKFIVQVGGQDTSLIRITQHTMAELFARECLGKNYVEILNGEQVLDKKQFELKIYISKIQMNLTFPDSSDGLDVNLRCVDFYPKILPTNRSDQAYDSPVNVFQRAVAWIQQQLNIGNRCLLPELMPVQTIFSVVEVAQGNVLVDIFLQNQQRDAVRKLVVKEIVGVQEVARMYTVVQAVRVWYRSVPNDIEFKDVMVHVTHPSDMPIRISDLGLKLNRHFIVPHPHVERKKEDFSEYKDQIKVQNLEKIPLGCLILGIDGDQNTVHPPRHDSKTDYLHALNSTIIGNKNIQKQKEMNGAKLDKKLTSFFTGKRSSKQDLGPHAKNQIKYFGEDITTQIKFTISKIKLDALEVPDNNIISWADASGDQNSNVHLGDQDSDPLPLAEIAYRAIAFTALKQKQLNGKQNIMNFILRPMWQIVCFPENRDGVKGAFQSRIIKLPDDHENEEYNQTMPVPMITSIYKTSFNRTKFKQAVRVIYPLLD